MQLRSHHRHQSQKALTRMLRRWTWNMWLRAYLRSRAGCRRRGLLSGLGPQPHPPACICWRGLERTICVRIVRMGLAVRSQRVGADGRNVAARWTVRMIGNRPQAGRREAVGGIGFQRGRGWCGRCGPSRPGIVRSRLARGGSDVNRTGPRPAQPACQRPRAIRPDL
jgi:hypothetical protein